MSNLIDFKQGRGGRSPVIAGTRVRVSDIARLHLLLEEQSTVERINKSLPHLSPDQIEAALQYWREHEKEIDEEMRDEDRVTRKSQAS